MPELPEVETVVRGLATEIVGRTFEDVRGLQGDPFKPSPAALATGLVGRRAVRAWRYGKQLFLELDGDLTLAGHLRMTGQLRSHAAGDEVQPHTHLIASLSDGRELRWRDVRRFGWLELLPTREVPRILDGLGPDALEVGRDEFRARVGRSRRALKALLLDQSCVAGIGNIYADETLFRARLHPLQVPSELTAKRLSRLFDSMQAVLAQAVELRGSSIDGNYLALDGYRGGFQELHQAYGRGGQPCVTCGRLLERILVAQRSSCFCPKCQRR